MIPKPIVINLPVKALPKGARFTQAVVAITSIITVLFMVAIVSVSLLTGNNEFRQKYGLNSGSSTVVASNSGSTQTTNSNASLPVVPVVTLSGDKPTAKVGEKATLTWSTTEKSSVCTGSDDWTGKKSPQGTEETPVFEKPQTYVFTLTCSTSTGTSFAVATVTVSAVDAPPTSVPSSTPTPGQVPAPQPQTSGTGNVATRPAVQLTASPTSVKTGESATLTWNVTNNPSSCSAGGAWSGSKAKNGSQSTGALTTVGNTSFSLTCSNSGGSATTTVYVSVTAPAPVVIAPTVTLSVSPSTITAGSAATVSWSATNNPSSCTAGGSWSGSKAASGSQNTGAKTQGTYTYTLSCTNSGGTATKSVSLTVNPAPVYCGGKTPCYGKTDLAAHASAGNCWAWNGDWVINMTSYAPVHKGGASAGSLENANATCNHDINAILRGAAEFQGTVTSEAIQPTATSLIPPTTQPLAHYWATEWGTMMLQNRNDMSKEKTMARRGFKNIFRFRKPTMSERFEKFRHEHALLFAAFIVGLTAIVVINTLFIVRMLLYGAPLFDERKSVSVYPSWTTSLQLARNGAEEAQIRNVATHDNDPVFAIDASQRMLVMDITIKNNTEKTQQFIPVNQLYVRSEDGTYSALHMSGLAPQPIAAKELAAGEAVTGQISFAIPKTVATPLLYVDTGWSRSVPLVIDVLH